MRTCSARDIENIIEIGRKFDKERAYWSWSDLAKATGWSVTTVRKYYNSADHYNYILNNEINSEENQDLIQNLPTYSGLYMLTNIVVDENNNIQYLIKVGKSTNLQKRVNSYKGMNPTAKCIATMFCYEEELDKQEQKMHQILRIRGGKRLNNTEWFAFNKDQFDKQVKLKFKEW